MLADTIPGRELLSAIATFRAAAETSIPSHWSDEDCRELFRLTSIRTVPAGEALIRHGEPDRTLYFVLDGDLEIILPSGDAFSMGRVAALGWSLGGPQLRSRRDDAQSIRDVRTRPPCPCPRSSVRTGTNPRYAATPRQRQNRPLESKSGNRNSVGCGPAAVLAPNRRQASQKMRKWRAHRCLYRTME